MPPTQFPMLQSAEGPVSVYIRCVTQSGKRPRSIGRRQTADKEGHLDAIGLAAK